MEIEIRNDLPFYRTEEVKKHGKNAENIWITFQEGVYDITNFVQSHSGGDKIFLAAGGPIDPYWNIYQQHLTPETIEILEELRIGNLDKRDITVIELKNENDPYRNDPKRYPAPIVKSKKPFNAETPSELLMGLNWKNSAVGNAKWTGVRLKDILIKAGINPNDKRIKHVIFRGADVDNEGNNYEASITFDKAMQDKVIIAYGMNDEDIPRDHGYPMRLLRKSSTVYPTDQQNFELSPSIQYCPLQSAFCYPTGLTKLSHSSDQFDVMSYAWSGVGRGITRVEVSIDGGETWQTAQLVQDPDQDHMCSWTFFKSTIKIPDGVKKLDLVCKVTDRSYGYIPRNLEHCGCLTMLGIMSRLKLQTIDL